MHHEENGIYRGLDTACKERVKLLATHGLTPFQILSILRSEGRKYVVYKEVYHFRTPALNSHFILHEYPFLSAKLYTKCSQKEDLISFQGSGFGLCLICRFRRGITTEWSPSEVFQNPPPRTELLALIWSCMGTVFPIAYFILEAGMGDTFRSGDESLTAFLTAVLGKLSNLNPLLFTGKEISQMSAI